MALAGCRENQLELRCARPSFFWRHGDGAGVLPLQAQVLEEFPDLAGTASHPSQLKDAFAGLGDGADGLFRERLADQVAIGSHLAEVTMGVPLPEAVQAPLAKRGHV